MHLLLKTKMLTHTHFFRVCRFIVLTALVTGLSTSCNRSTRPKINSQDLQEISTRLGVSANEDEVHNYVYCVIFAKGRDRKSVENDIKRFILTSRISSVGKGGIEYYWQRGPLSELLGTTEVYFSATRAIERVYELQTNGLEEHYELVKCE